MAETVGWACSAAAAADDEELHTNDSRALTRELPSVCAQLQKHALSFGGRNRESSKNLQQQTDASLHWSSVDTFVSGLGWWRRRHRTVLFFQHKQRRRTTLQRHHSTSTRLQRRNSRSCIFGRWHDYEILLPMTESTSLGQQTALSGGQQKFYTMTDKLAPDRCLNYMCSQASIKHVF